MGLFDWIFGKKSVVDSLKNEHKKIISIYSKIVKLMEKEKFDRLPKHLKEFYYTYSRHILYEDNYFYSKLRKIYSHDKNKQLFIKLKREEMDEITKFIEKFINKFKTHHDIRENFEEFKKEIQVIGEVLSARVKFEESELYPLYNV